MEPSLGLESGRLDVIGLYDGSTLQTHGPEMCAGDFCCIHRPSAHALNDRPLVWRGDTGYPLLERLCVHGVGHPDPDSLSYIVSRAYTEQGRANRETLALHSCDGCCAGAGPDAG